MISCPLNYVRGLYRKLARVCVFTSVLNCTKLSVCIICVHSCTFANTLNSVRGLYTKAACLCVVMNILNCVNDLYKKPTPLYIFISLLNYVRGFIYKTRITRLYSYESSEQC